MKPPRLCQYCFDPIGPRRAPWAITCSERCSRKRQKELHAARQARYRERVAALEAAAPPKVQLSPIPLGPRTVTADKTLGRYRMIWDALQATDSPMMQETYRDELIRLSVDLEDEPGCALPSQPETDGRLRPPPGVDMSRGRLLWRLSKVAEFAGVSPRTVQRWEDQGRIPQSLPNRRGWWDARSVRKALED